MGFLYHFDRSAIQQIETRSQVDDRTDHGWSLESAIPVRRSVADFTGKIVGPAGIVFPGVGRHRIRTILRKLKTAGELRSCGHGAGARWERT